MTACITYCASVSPTPPPKQCDRVHLFLRMPFCDTHLTAGLRLRGVRVAFIPLGSALVYFSNLARPKAWSGYLKTLDKRRWLSNPRCHLSQLPCKLCGFHRHLELLGRAGVWHSSLGRKVQVCPEGTCWPALPWQLLSFCSEVACEPERGAWVWTLQRLTAGLSCSWIVRELTGTRKDTGFLCWGGNQVWWCRPEIPALGRRRWKD